MNNDELQAFKRGVDALLTLKPLREWIAAAIHQMKGESK